jgi:membrane-associated PAP2 superfamily phosphatase
MAHPAFDFRIRRLVRPLRQWLFDWPLLAVCGLLALVSLVFLAAPHLDLALTALFYDPAAGFDELRSTPLVFLRETGRVVEWAFALAVTAPLLVKFLAPESRLLVAPRTSLFVLAAWAIGPGLIVNGLLKSHWGRARPRELVEFGGDGTFSPAWWISDQCGMNCSFVSGEAASAFWLVALAFVAPSGWRPTVAIVALAFAASVSFTRVAMGGHFVSDVLIAWLLTLLVMVALHKLVLQGLPPQFDGEVEAAIARGGRAIRRRWAARGNPPANRP